MKYLYSIILLFLSTALSAQIIHKSDRKKSEYRQVKKRVEIKEFLTYNLEFELEKLRAATGDS